MSNETLNDGMIERYLDGTMEAAERERFEQMLSSDERLRRSVKIEQAMTKAMAIDRVAMPARHAEMRSRAIDAIARIAPSATALPPAPFPQAVDNKPKLYRRRGFIYSTLGALLLLGGWLVTRPAEEAPAPQARPGIERRPTLPAAPAPSLAAPVESPVIAEPSEETKPAVEKKESTMSPAASSRGARRTPAVTTQPAGRSRERSTSTADQPRGEDSRPPVFKDPTATSDVSVDQGNNNGGR